MTRLTGPGYTVNDLVYWAGFIAGTIVAYLLLRPYEMHQVVRLLVGIGAGVAVGVGCEYLFRAARRPPGPPGEGGGGAAHPG